MYLIQNAMVCRVSVVFNRGICVRMVKRLGSWRSENAYVKDSIEHRLTVSFFVFELTFFVSSFSVLYNIPLCGSLLCCTWGKEDKYNFFRLKDELERNYCLLTSESTREGSNLLLGALVRV